MSYSRVNRHAIKKQNSTQLILGLIFVGLTVLFTTQSVNTESYVTLSNKNNSVDSLKVSTIETTVPFTIAAKKTIVNDLSSLAIETVNLIKSVNHSKVTEVPHVAESSVTAQEQMTESVNYNSVNTAQVVASHQSNTYYTPVATSKSYPSVLSNGNTAGAIGSEAAAQMAAATGVPQSTWEYIIARESNGNPNVANASGASGLFQTMPGWGSTATVQDQINTALKAYNSQGLSAWGMQ